MDPEDLKSLKPAEPPATEAGTWSDESALRIALSREMYNVTTDAVIALGVTRLEQEEAMKLCLQSDERQRPSRAILKVTEEISLLLATWGRDPRYLQPDGTPKALPIHGPGASLESLVAFCAPDVPVSDVVSILCTHSDVKRLKSDKIAILGNPVKITERTVAVSVAHLVVQVRRLAETIVFNAKLPAEHRGEGRFERAIWGILPLKLFLEWAQAIRGPLQKASDHVDADLEQRPAGNEVDDKRCGVGIFLFREDGDLG